jgi:hypothetical protein
MRGWKGENDVPMTKRSRTKAPARAVAIMRPIHTCAGAWVEVDMMGGGG